MHPSDKWKSRPWRKGNLLSAYCVPSTVLRASPGLSSNNSRGMCYCCIYDTNWRTLQLQRTENPTQTGFSKKQWLKTLRRCSGPAGSRGSIIPSGFHLTVLSVSLGTTSLYHSWPGFLYVVAPRHWRFTTPSWAIPRERQLLCPDAFTKNSHWSLPLASLVLKQSP